MSVKLLLFISLINVLSVLVTCQSKATKYCEGLTSPGPRFHGIIGGIQTKEGEFPHMVALGYEVHKEIKWLCGGSLISSQFVLTAGHCTQSDVGLIKKIRLGTRNLRNPSVGYQDISVKEAITHPLYRAASHYNDIGLVKLAKNVKFSPNTIPACLHTTSLITSKGLIAIGWGRTDFGGLTSDDLLKVTLYPVSSRTCNKYFKNIGKKRLEKGIDDKSQLCAGGDSEDPKDTCQGDSGGPLGYKKRRQHYVAGITSFGKACGLATIPAVYTRVSAFVPWIESIVWK